MNSLSVEIGIERPESTSAGCEMPHCKIKTPMENDDHYSSRCSAVP